MTYGSVESAKAAYDAGFLGMSSSFAEKGNETNLSKQSSRDGAAATINHNRHALAYAIHKRDMALCELSHWTVGRMFRGTSTDDPPTDFNHSCEALNYERSADPGTGDKGGAGGVVTAYHPYVSASGIQNGTPNVRYTASNGSRQWFCGHIPCKEYEVYSYNDYFDTRIKYYDAERRTIDEEIDYEKLQRDNLETLRDEKGIEDWHLEIIYTDREEIRAETNPSSEGGQNYIQKQRAVPYIWLGVATSIALGGLFVGREIRNYRAAKKGQV